MDNTRRLPRFHPDMPIPGVCDWMAFIPIALSVAGTLMQANAQQQAGAAAAQQGKAQQVAANYQAAEIDQQAGQDRASSQRQAVDVRRQAGLATSRAQAVAAASGGGATDPTVLTNSGRITGEGEYSALTALFNGEERARGLETTANLGRFTGQQQAVAGDSRQSAYDTGATATLLSGAGSLFSKYGMGGPPTAMPTYTGAAGNTPGGLRVGGLDGYS